MKIPFIKYHIFVLSEERVLEMEQDEIKLDALRSLTSDFIPEIDQLIIARHEAKVGHSSHGRRKARRKVLRRAHELKVMIEQAA